MSISIPLEVLIKKIYKINDFKHLCRKNIIPRLNRPPIEIAGTRIHVRAHNASRAISRCRHPRKRFRSAEAVASLAQIFARGDIYALAPLPRKSRADYGGTGNL